MIQAFTFPKVAFSMIVLLLAYRCLAQATPPSDARPATGPSSRTSSASLFAEDFETGGLDPAIWTRQITGSNQIKVQSEKVAHGHYALQVNCPAPANKTWAFIAMNEIPDALRKHHFGRMSLYLTQHVPTRHTIFFMSGTSGFPRNKFQEVATANGRWQLTYVDLQPTADPEDYHAGGKLPVGRWLCLEWEFNDHPNHTAIWVDGEKTFEADFVSKTTGATTDLIGGFTDYAFGIRLWGQAPEPFDLYYDDIAISTERMGKIDEPH